MATKVTIDQFIRITSTKGKIYLALKDGKVHQLKTVTAMLTKSGFTGSFYAAFMGLNRVLYTHMGQHIVFEGGVSRDWTKGTVRIAPLKAVEAKTASKPKTAKVAPVAKTEATTTVAA